MAARTKRTAGTASENAQAAKRRGRPPKNKDATGSGASAGNGATSGRSRIPEDLSDRASRVVHQAASILEEEMAAGIAAAKQVEGRFFNA
ncbi:MAG: hypothetical protein Q7O66_18815, partial [Dehalococcoidia bacterium]|nr:hypothetical protein [Dehalococcoidia bacterium]